jgi:hypothetical protein
MKYLVPIARINLEDCKRMVILSSCTESNTLPEIVGAVERTPFR